MGIGTGDVIGLTKAELRKFLALSRDEKREVIEAMSPEALARWDGDFDWWAHRGQLAPEGRGWRTWLMMAGRGYGKTRAGAEWVQRLAMGRGRRIALAGATIDEARAVMVEGKSGLIAVAAGHGVELNWEPSLGRLTWPTGSVARLYSGDNADGLRGPEHHFAWCDELAKWRQADAAWDNLQMGLRLGMNPRALVTTTPRPMRLLERIRDEAGTVVTGGRTDENLSLPKEFVEAMVEAYGGSRVGRQELDAGGSEFQRQG